MAVNVNVGELYRSAESQVKLINDILKTDKRTNKNWRDEVLASVNVIKQTLDVFNEQLMILTNVSPNQGKQPALYSDAVQSKKLSTTSTKHVVMVSPKNDETVKDSEQTLKILQTTTNTRSMKVGVNRVKKVRNKGLIVELRSEDECKTMVNTIEASPHLKATIPHKKNPRVIVHGIEVSFPENELVESIIEQNPAVKLALTDASTEIQIRFVKKSRDGSTKYAVIEVSSAIFRALQNCDKLYVGYTRCSFNEYISVIRCYKCLGFGHFSSNCDKPQICSHCSEAHNAHDCSRMNTECINCKSQNERNRTRRQYECLNIHHPATSVECPIYKKVDKNKIADIIGADHIIIILVIFCLILSCMCFAFLYNCIKKLIHDHKIIREHLRQSRQSRLDEVGKTAPPLMSPRMTPSAVRSRANSSSAGGGGNPLLADSEHDDSSPHRSAPDDCYVPSAGDLLPILLQANHGTSMPSGVQPPAGVPANGDAVFLRDNHHHHHHHYGEDECDDLEMSTFPLPEMRDNECQTRESLFLNTNSDASMTPPPPPPPITPRYNSITTSESRSMPRPPQHNSSSNTSGFSTFGYGNRGGSATRGGKDFSTLPQQGHHHHHHHHHHAGSVTPGQPPPMAQAQFRAEAVIEMEQQQQQQQRPFSVDSTKSAPDVIVTH